TYGIDDLARDGQTAWEGVRNYQVRNMMRDEMKKGDPVFFYHSSCPQPGIVGTGTISGPARPDPTQFDPRSKYHAPASRPENPIGLLADMRFGRKFERVITLDELKRHDALADMPVLRRGNRLSVTPVSEGQRKYILGILAVPSDRK